MNSPMDRIELPRIFIGTDHNEEVAGHVFASSIQRHASGPVGISQISLHQLEGLMHRPRDPLQSNDFAFSRWLVPALCGYQGWAIFADCDMLCMDDIYKLWALRDPRYAVQVVQHKHTPKNDKKYLNQIQTRYDKKNWSSVMLFNNDRCQNLTPTYVNAASGLDLHQFKWLNSEALVGPLPHRWNHLVGFDDPKEPDVAIAHFTEGGPYFDETQDCGYAKQWESEFDFMTHCTQVSDMSEEA